jgi:hypothetical protein
MRHLPHILVAGLLMTLTAGCTSTPAVTETKAHAFWPPSPDQPRIQFLTAYNSTSDLRAKQSKMDELIYGKETSADLEINKPYGVAMWNGRVYVCDIRGSGILVLDLKKRQTRLMGASGSGTIQRAVDIKVGPDGSKYVVDNARNAVMIFDAEERFLRSFTHKDFNPVAVAVWGDELFTCDMRASTVKVLDRNSGAILRTIGKSMEQDGEFVRPTSIAMDLEGNLLVADIMKCQIMKFTRDGKLLATWGKMGNRPGDLARPKHLMMSQSNILYVADAAFNNVQLLDNEGKAMMFFGMPGAHPGAMLLPAGLCISEDPADLELFRQYIHPAYEARRLVLVTNQLGPNRIAVYAEGELKPGKTLADLAPSRADVTAGPVSGPATQPAIGPATE